jgi:hypothetical protein
MENIFFNRLECFVESFGLQHFIVSDFCLFVLICMVNVSGLFGVNSQQNNSTKSKLKILKFWKSLYTHLNL